MEAASMVPGSLFGLSSSIDSLLACPAGYGMHIEPGSITVMYSRVPTLRLHLGAEGHWRLTLT